MDNKLYTLGFSGKSYLQCNNDGTIIIVRDVDRTKVSLICNKTTNSSRLVVRIGKIETIIENAVKRGVIKQMSENGDRWEADWYNEQPFGFERCLHIFVICSINY